MSSFTDITIETYTPKSFAVRGETRKYKEDLKKLGGKYNSRLRGGPGWIFPAGKQKDVEDFIDQGQRLVTTEEIERGEIKTKQWENERESGQNTNQLILKMLNRIDKRLQKQEEMLKNLIVDDVGDQSTVPTTSHVNSEEDEEDEKVPVRLLRKN